MNKSFLLISLALITAIPFFIYDGAFVLVKNQHNVQESKEVKGIGGYLINLDRSVDRLAAITPLLQQMQLPVQRISAVNGKILKSSYIDSITDKEFYISFMREDPDVGSIGCYLSHVKAWQEFLDSDYEYAIVFEDDVSFDPVLLEEAVRALTKHTNWDICNIESYHRGTPVVLTKLTSDHSLVKYLTSVTHTGTYVINRKAATALLQYAFPIKMPVDHLISRSWETGLKFTGIEPRLSHQTAAPSLIRPNIKKVNFHWYDAIKRNTMIIKTHIMLFFNNL